ncbi:hypothetical protein [Rhizobium sp. BK176]|uniref:hypothetical protein n=1 Tax=Rhizobium sp. BK176 TaxID=2587071 RepID=UPI00216956DF|nr:hypothetical protein [Rhizobium sp. BK176]MCS4088609.1 hypothetical protein [Rhizobium sp. BK176]
MGSKSQVRSMQRGAQKRDREPMTTGSDYGGMPPSLRAEDRAHLGLTDDAFEKLASSLRQKIIGYAQGGFRKPADVCRLLNREKIRTLSGTDWNPRLVYFLLARIYGDRPRAVKEIPLKTFLLDQNSFDAVRRAVRVRDQKEALPPIGNPTPSPRRTDTSPIARGDRQPTAQLKVAKPRKPIKVRPPADAVPLSPDEMARRLLALQAHFSR